MPGEDCGGLCFYVIFIFLARTRQFRHHCKLASFVQTTLGGIPFIQTLQPARVLPSDTKRTGGLDGMPIYCE